MQVACWDMDPAGRGVKASEPFADTCSVQTDTGIIGTAFYLTDSLFDITISII